MTVKRGPRKKLNKRELKRALQVMQAEVIADTQQRTGRGIDVNGNAFQPYSQRYANAKRTAQRGTTVNLTLFGSMLQSLHAFSVKLGQNTAIVGFLERRGFNARFRSRTGGQGKIQRGGRRNVNDGELATVHQRGLDNMPRRKFLGISRDGKARLRRVLGKMKIFK